MALIVIFEKFELVEGSGRASTDLRVRKFNRTTTVLNGTFTLHTYAGNEIVLSLDLFHSRLGNQQFNHYPMKLPTSGLCEFIDNLHADYGEWVTKVENLPPKGECPIAPVTVGIRDEPFPTKVIPQFIPRGLWKAVITGTEAGKKVLVYYVLVKAYDEY